MCLWMATGQRVGVKELAAEGGEHDEQEADAWDVLRADALEQDLE